MYHSNFPSLIFPIGQSVLSFFLLSGLGHWKCNQQQGVKYIYPIILLWHFLRMIRMYYGDVFEEVWRNISNGWSSDSGRTMPLDNTGHICWFTIFSALSRRQAMVNNRVETAVAVTGGSGGGSALLCRLRRSDLGSLPALLHGSVLAHALPQVLMLPGSAGRDRQHLLQ